jgi:diguanylate cyclase (GGDEF)-like protein
MRQIFLSQEKMMLIKEDAIVSIEPDKSEESNYVNAGRIINSLSEKVNFLENYDSVTGLPNRNSFIKRISERLSTLEKGAGMNAAVLYIDLDDFHRLNDAYGYEIGDVLLDIASSKLKKCIRENDFIARIDGDEFAVLLESFDDKDDIINISDRILNSFSDTIKISGQEYFINVSIGITTFSDGSNNVSDIVKNAGTALYKAKTGGKNKYQFYEEGINKQIQHILKLESSLRCAVCKNEIIAHYQPQVNAETGMIVGLEALARWNHPENGIIYPDAFIPAAEKSGLIVPIGKNIIGIICEQNKKWREMGLNDFHIAVNISAKQLQQKDFAHFLKEALNESGMDPASLELEITESVLIQSMNSLTELFKDIKDMGITISLDDFGIGYSSLSYLKVLPVDKIKLDRSFINDIGKNKKTEALITALIFLADKMKLELVAEGVETIEQVDFLTQAGCWNMQGYLYSKPVSADQLETILSNGRMIIRRDSYFYYQI